MAANIFYDILTDAFPSIVSATKPGGLVFASGILKSQAEACLAAGTKAGVVWDTVLTKGKWVSARGTRS